MACVELIWSVNYVSLRGLQLNPCSIRSRAASYCFSLVCKSHRYVITNYVYAFVMNVK